MAISEPNLSALHHFADAASEFCQFIDSFTETTPRDCFAQLELLLPKLLNAILPVKTEMPDGEHPEFETLEMTHEQTVEVAKSINMRIQTTTRELAERYERIEDCSEDANRAGMLWDDLTDIYRDLHNGLSCWNVGTNDSRAEAAWNWRFDYESHWGNHLFRAMLTVHDIRYRLYGD